MVFSYMTQFFRARARYYLLNAMQYITSPVACEYERVATLQRDLN